MAGKWIEVLGGSLEQKKQYRQYTARFAALPEPYRTAGVTTGGDTILTMLGDFADLWERAALDATPLSAIAGEDPVEFVETFTHPYGGTRWIDKERARLTKAISPLD